jgi:hypothetical protein
MKPIAEFTMGLSLGVYFLGLQILYQGMQKVWPFTSDASYFILAGIFFVATVVLWRAALIQNKKE